MSFWDRLLYDPSSLLRNRKWWQIALLVLPWLLLVLLVSCAWFLAPGRLMGRYTELAKNVPLDGMKKGLGMQIKELEDQRREIAERSRNIEIKLAEAQKQFEATQAKVATETHAELKARLYGETDD
jgi:hypothetical protein